MQKLVMVVDDSVTLRTIVDLIFRKTEFTPVIASGALEALTLLSEVKPELIIIDAEMPDVDGYQLARDVRIHENAEDVPLLLMVSDKGPDEARLGDTDIDGYVIKPFTSSEMLDPVRMLTGVEVRHDVPLSFEQLMAARRAAEEARAKELAMLAAEKKKSEDEELNFTFDEPARPARPSRPAAPQNAAADLQLPASPPSPALPAQTFGSMAGEITAPASIPSARDRERASQDITAPTPALSARDRVRAAFEAAAQEVTAPVVPGRVEEPLEQPPPHTPPPLVEPSPVKFETPISAPQNPPIPPPPPPEPELKFETPVSSRSNAPIEPPPSASLHDTAPIEPVESDEPLPVEEAHPDRLPSALPSPPAPPAPPAPVEESGDIVEHVAAPVREPMATTEATHDRRSQSVTIPPQLRSNRRYGVVVIGLVLLVVVVIVWLRS